MNTSYLKVKPIQTFPSDRFLVLNYYIVLKAKIFQYTVKPVFKRYEYVGFLLRRLYHGTVVYGDIVHLIL